MDNKIDVILCTKNSESILKDCLDSLFNCIPICHLIVIDGFSSDNTVGIVKNFSDKFGNVKIIQTKASLGKSREIGINIVDSNWFAFVDSDVILRSNWFENVFEKIRENVGAVESNFIHHYPVDAPKFPGYLENEAGEYIQRREKFDKRGYTIATLIKTSSVANISIPDDLRIFEDEYIRRWIVRQGLEWIKVDNPVVDHFKENPNPYRDAYLTGEYSFKYNLYPAWKIIIGALIMPAKFLFFVYKFKSLVISYNLIKYNFYMLKGMIYGIMEQNSN